MKKCVIDLELSKKQFPNVEYIFLGAIGHSTNANQWDWIDGNIHFLFAFVIKKESRKTLDPKINNCFQARHFLFSPIGNQTSHRDQGNQLFYLCAQMGYG